MSLPLRKVLKSPKFDAVVSFKKSDGSRSSRTGGSSLASPPTGRGSSKHSPPTGIRREKTSKLSTRSQHKPSSSSSSAKGARGKVLSNATTKEDGGVTSSVVAVLADKGAAAARKSSYNVAFHNGVLPNRAERLQVRLNALESEMNRLKLHEEQLEHRLKRFLRQKTSLVNTIDDIHLKLEGLARSHKSISNAN